MINTFYYYAPTKQRHVWCGPNIRQTHSIEGVIVSEGRYLCKGRPVVGDTVNAWDGTKFVKVMVTRGLKRVAKQVHCHPIPEMSGSRTASVPNEAPVLFTEDELRMIFDYAFAGQTYFTTSEIVLRDKLHGAAKVLDPNHNGPTYKKVGDNQFKAVWIKS